MYIHLRHGLHYKYMDYIARANMHRLPLIKDKRKRWIDVIARCTKQGRRNHGIPDLLNRTCRAMVCADHFSERDSANVSTDYLRRRLNNAIPGFAPVLTQSPQHSLAAFRRHCVDSLYNDH